MRLGIASTPNGKFLSKIRACIGSITLSYATHVNDSDVTVTLGMGPYSGEGGSQIGNGGSPLYGDAYHNSYLAKLFATTCDVVDNYVTMWGATMKGDSIAKNNCYSLTMNGNVVIRYNFLYTGLGGLTFHLNGGLFLGYLTIGLGTIYM